MAGAAPRGGGEPLADTSTRHQSATMPIGPFVAG